RSSSAATHAASCRNPTSDYYGGSVALGRAPPRQSPISCLLDVQGGSRCPFRVLAVAQSNPPPPKAVHAGSSEIPVIWERLGVNHLAQSAFFTVWTLGFTQSCIHHTVRVSASVPLGGFAVPRLYEHALVPFGFRRQVGSLTRGSHAQPFPCC